MSMKPAIVVVAYNRVKALQRLLDSLKNADYSGFSDITTHGKPTFHIRFPSFPWDHSLCSREHKPMTMLVCKDSTIV